MYNLEGYFEASTISEATELLASRPHLRIIAGGTDVLIKIQHGQIEKPELLSIRKIKALEAIQERLNGDLVLGSLTTFAAISKDPVIKGRIPVLAEAAISMGGPQIRNVATLGGNICNGATSADSASTLFALNARLRLQSSQGERVIPIQEFYLGPGRVDLRPGEMLTEIIVSREDYEGFGGHYIKFAMRKAMDIATLGVSAVCRLKDRTVFDNVRIGLGVAAPTPIRCREAEAYARGKTVSAETLAEIGKLAVKSTNARTSWRASKEYREHLVEELTQRALKAAITNSGGPELA